MSEFKLEYVLGARSTELPGQWIEGSVEFGNRSFSIMANVCRNSSSGEFSMYRLDEHLDQPFTAELFLGLLSLIAEAEFRPSASGIQLFYSGDGPAPTDEIARILEPQVRANATASVVPESLADKLRAQLHRISRMRRLQRGMARLNS